MEDIVRKSFTEIIILNPSVENLLDYSLYKLSFEEDVFLVPLWHQELIYESRNKKNVIVQCIPELPDGITLDENNNLYVKLCCSVYDVIHKEKIQFLIGERSFSINCDEIKCKQSQEIILQGIGIPSPFIDPTDFFDNSMLGNIIVHLKLV
jgi:hypothetical protein